jgi:YWFCY protein/TraM recognition site of TraD and TraG
MVTGEDIHGMRKILHMTLWISVAVLLLHFYYFDYAAFRQWGLSSTLSDNILQVIGRTGLFNQVNTSKLIALAFLALSMLGTKGKKSEKLSYRRGTIFILTGLLLYSTIYFILSLDANVFVITYTYISVTAVGYLMMLFGATQISRVISQSMRKGFLHTDNLGFQQEEKLIASDFSINLAARYSWKGKFRKSYVNLINPRRGILIMGSPGSGKSWFIIEPIIRQMIAKGFAIFLYDFKYDQLTRLAYQLFQQHRDKYPSSAAFFSINFTDLTRSHRCNVIDPATMEYLADAVGASRTILLSMNKTWVSRQGEFFVESPINYLAAIIWFLRKFQGGIYCTLPHVIELAQAPYEKLFTVLNTEPEINTLISPFIEAFRNKSMEMLDGQTASARIPLGRLASPDLYYVLSGNDCTLDINDPAAPRILCMGGDPPRQEALAPILSLYIDRLNKLVNRPGKYRTALICDEFATVRAYSMTTTIATARSNDIVPVMAIQDLSQLRTRYSRDEADLILNISGNILCGQVSGESARSVCERFPGAMQYKRTVSLNDSGTSISRAEQVSDVMSVATIATLSSGEFVGIVADDPDKKLPLKAFHASLVKEDLPRTSGDSPPLQPLPVIRLLNAAAIEANFHLIKKEAADLVDQELARILADPKLAGMIVKR